MGRTERSFEQIRAWSFGRTATEIVHCQSFVRKTEKPTSALDPISTGRIEELCEELSKNTTIVMVTHNMQQATRISDKTGFFLLGELIEFGDTDDIFTEPKDERTERYITGRFG